MANFFEALLGATVPGRAVSDYRQRDALRNFSGELQGQDLSAPGARQAALAKYGQITGDLAPLLGTRKTQDLPAALQLANEYEAAINTGDVDRANRIAAFAKTVDKNVMMTPTGQYAPLPGLPDALGQIEYGKNYGGSVGDLTAQGELKPGVEGDVRAAQLAQDLVFNPQIKEGEAAAQEVGKRLGEAESSLTFNKANLPKLEAVVKDLSALGKKATYTVAGQAEDFIQRQLGLDPGEDAKARTAYIAKVDNEILPLLRDTFGAAFTVAEGESLRATLGQKDLSPSEKDEVLKAFIDQKKQQIGSLERQTGQPESRLPSLPAQNKPYVDDIGVLPLQIEEETNVIRWEDLP